jgi:hypothetical protein
LKTAKKFLKDLGSPFFKKSPRQFQEDFDFYRAAVLLKGHHWMKTSTGEILYFIVKR